MAEPPVRVFTAARQGLVFRALRELWLYRELLVFLVRRDISVRYKHAAIGLAWVFLQPALLTLTLSAIFHRVAPGSSTHPYALYVFTGVVPWLVIARALSEGASSLLTDQKLLTRVYFPRIIIPTSAVCAAVFDAAVCLLATLPLLALMGYVSVTALIGLPVALLSVCISALGFAYWLAALNAEYRDVQYLIPFVSQLMFFLAPVVYQVVPGVGTAQSWLMLNPLVGSLGLTRAVLLGHNPLGWPTLLGAQAAALLFALSGWCYFRWRERTVVDLIGGQS